MKRVLLPHAVLAVFAAVAGQAAPARPVSSPAAPVPPAPAIPTATGLLAACVESLPREKLVLNGALGVRRQRGIPVAEHPFRLTLDWGATPPAVQCDLLAPDGKVRERFSLLRRDGRNELHLRGGPDLSPLPDPSLAGRVAGTDLTWLDLTLDFLWWRQARLEGTDTVRGRDCDVVVAVAPAPASGGCAAVRLWLDREVHFLLRAEELDAQGRPVRRLSVETFKKFGERWLIRELEIETVGSPFRTRLRVEDVPAP